MTGSAEGRDPLLCPFTPPSFCPWGDTTAAARKEHQPLMDAQWLLFVVPRGERVVCVRCCVEFPRQGGRRIAAAAA